MAVVMMMMIPILNLVSNIR